MGLNVVPGQLYSQRRLIERRKRVFGEEYWNYAMPGSFEGDNSGWAVWPVRSYCWGATGTLPWQTIGSEGELDKAAATALMYPGRRFGLDEPVASIRMKAWRDGLQTAELLDMLRRKMEWNDVQLRAWVGQVLSLDGWKDAMDPKADSPIVTLSGVGGETRRPTPGGDDGTGGGASVGCHTAWFTKVTMPESPELGHALPPSRKGMAPGTGLTLTLPSPFEGEG